MKLCNEMTWLKIGDYNTYFEKREYAAFSIWKRIKMIDQLDMLSFGALPSEL